MTAEEFIKECEKKEIPTSAAERYIYVTMQDVYTEHDISILLSEQVTIKRLKVWKEFEKAKKEKKL